MYRALTRLARRLATADFETRLSELHCWNIRNWALATSLVESSGKNVERGREKKKKRKRKREVGIRSRDKKKQKGRLY